MECSPLTVSDVFPRTHGLKRAAILALALAGAGTAAQAELNKAQYELQERCGKDAAKFFKRFSAPDGASYTNHYNPDLNGCFALLNLSRPGGAPSGSGRIWLEWELWDVNENRQIDVMGFEPDPGEKSSHAVGTPEPTLLACMEGNFLRCGDRNEYAKAFARSVLTYMQRSSAN